MMVYVDNMKATYGRMIMCHIIADTIEELHEMADKIGIDRKWFQSHSKHLHYDICLNKRKIAISYGAKEIDMRETVKILKQIGDKNEL